MTPQSPPDMDFKDAVEIVRPPTRCGACQIDPRNGCRHPLGPTYCPHRPLPAAKLIFGECECCGAPNRVLHPCTVSGMDASPCAVCRGGSLADDIDDLRDEIDRLRPNANTAAQWSHICALQGALIEATNSVTCAKLRAALVEAGDADVLAVVAGRR